MRDKLIKILADGRFHSGEKLGEQLGVSRTAVWKHLRKLESMGLSLERVRGTGYKIAAGTELLAVAVIEQQLMPATRRALKSIALFTSLESTNTYARQHASEQPSHGLLVLAEHQSAGRGRRGKRWVSPFGSHLAMSLVWEFEARPHALEGLSLAVGVAIKRALATYGVAGVQLKWPNDIYFDGKKIAGILLEMVVDPMGHCSVIIGVGINFQLCELQAQSIDQAWTDVASHLAADGSRNTLCAAIIDNLVDVLSAFVADGFAPYQQEWKDADAWHGKRCTLSTARDSTTGTALGVDERGALIMQLDDGRESRFMGGELSLRLAP